MSTHIPSSNLNQPEPMRAIPYGHGQSQKIARINIKTLEINSQDLDLIINQTGHARAQIIAQLQQTYTDWAKI